MSSNNAFFSFEGTISRKDYCINSLILIFILLGLNFINFNHLFKFLNENFLYSIIMYIVFLFKFIAIICLISVIYRRISDFSNSTENTKRIFGILYIFPVFYYYWGNYITNIFPILKNILDIMVYLIIIPTAFIATIIFAFLKRK